ncbi:hypothetical protein D5086_004512 [Populus alba]|uniref:Uncharacterized protein n=1 Tax=Populus alba TaxID=43335 RepID=A0ACC4CS15_POPAL
MAAWGLKPPLGSRMGCDELYSHNGVMDPNARAERRWGVMIPGGTTQSHYNLILHQKSDLFLIIHRPFLVEGFKVVKQRDMASTACFLHHHALTTPARSTSSSQRQVVNLKPAQLVCRAQKQAVQEEDEGVVSRRLALTVLIGAAALGSKVAPADAAYGESANIFGKAKTNTDFLPYNGDGFKLSIPAKWNPSKEREFPGQVLRYEDNFDATSNLSVMVTPTDTKSITDYGSPEQFLSKVDYLLGKQSSLFATSSEGGFDTNTVATANILETSTPVIDGKQYYFLSVLTRTADGDEGGKHQLITATVKDGKLYICKAQAGDKRWFKGARKFVESAASSFSVA